VADVAFYPQCAAFGELLLPGHVCMQFIMPRAAVWHAKLSTNATELFDDSATEGRLFLLSGVELSCRFMEWQRKMQ